MSAFDPKQTPPPCSVGNCGAPRTAIVSIGRSGAIIKQAEDTTLRSEKPPHSYPATATFFSWFCPFISF